MVGLDVIAIYRAFRENGKVGIKEGNGVSICLLKPELWKVEMGFDWVYLIFDLFQIRTICEPFSEVSLDIVEFASKPTIYQSPANKLALTGPVQDGCIRVSLIREPNWNKLLFQFSQPVLFRIEKNQSAEFETSIYFPLLNPSKKELYLGPEGEVKIIKG